jgi:hypothetical protein
MLNIIFSRLDAESIDYNQKYLSTASENWRLERGGNLISNRRYQKKAYKDNG